MTWPAVFLVSHDISKFILHTVVGVYEVRHSLALPAFLALSTSISLTVLLHFSQQWIYLPFVHPYIGILWSRFSSLLYLGLITLTIDASIPKRVSTPRAREQWYSLLITCASILPVILIALNRGHVQTSLSPALLSRLPKEYTYLARRESITGMLTVVENAKDGYRVLKCDHSLLGGLWTGIKSKELSAQGIPAEQLETRTLDEAESVYTAFLVQEAVRLVVRPAPDPTDDKALIMYISPIAKGGGLIASGLGIGVTAKSFHKSGINVTIVELDPLIHQYAQQYFGLPTLRGPVYYQDGRKFIETAASRGDKWDYIVHDVFTGGSVPAELFTREMWQATKTALSPDGVLVVVIAPSNPPLEFPPRIPPLESPPRIPNPHCGRPITHLVRAAADV